ncbi:PREDICTED: uncharacterized protein LOC108620058 [Drosophila arizonae]|uniref:Uncharacterized protein LOC108620058 n=1 Tax=Drosophila arizonae TaxID=7263 RepID=A0ABM1PYX9_DROAR|nr:PREDICTED: uncharacterized protein LOC108620058 [Drosophila arizonae]
MSNSFHMNLTGMQKKLGLRSMHLPLKDSTQLYSMLKSPNGKLCNLSAQSIEADNKHKNLTANAYRDFISLPNKNRPLDHSQAKTNTQVLKSCLKQPNGPKRRKVVRFSCDA